MFHFYDWPLTVFLPVYILQANLLFSVLVRGSVFSDDVVFYGDVDSWDTVTSHAALTARRKRHIVTSHYHDNSFPVSANVTTWKQKINYVPKNGDRRQYEQRIVMAGRCLTHSSIRPDQSWQNEITGGLHSPESGQVKDDEGKWLIPGYWKVGWIKWCGVKLLVGD